MAEDKKISELNPVVSLNGNEEVEVLQVGSNKRSSLTKIKEWIASTLSFDWIDFTPQDEKPTHVEGKLFYDIEKKALSYYNEVSDVTVNLGLETLVRFYNNTGSTIPNGAVIYRFGSETGLADCYSKSKSRLIAVATHDIENNSYGYATKFGELGGLDTTGFNEGDLLYLGTNGQLTISMPTDGGYLTIIGYVRTVDATDGVILVDIHISQLTVEVTDTNGFPPDQRTGTTLTFVNGTRTLTLAPTGADFHYYMIGEKYSKTTAQNIVISNVTGSHVVYFDGETISELVNGSSEQIEAIILNKCIIAYIYWNATLGRSIRVYDERHGISMPPVVHLYNHRHFGAQYTDGLTPNGYVVDGTGASDSHAQFGILTGRFDDEDNEHVTNTIASTTGLPFIYRFGASGEYRDGTNAGFSFPVGATPLPQYNQFTGGAWQLTECPTGYFMCLHEFADPDITKTPFVNLGIATYTTLALATAGASTELSTILAGLPGPENVKISTFILECKTSFTNSVNARLVRNSNGTDYLDWRTSELRAGTTPSNHANLTGLEAAGIGVTWGHVNESLYKLIYPNRISEASNGTPTPTGDYSQNEYYLTALATNATFAAPSGSVSNGNNLVIRIKDNGTARTLAFNAIYRPVGVILPTTTIISKTIYLGCIYNSTDSKWDVVSYIIEA